VELFRQAYTDELVDFAGAVRARRDGVPPSSSDFTITPGGADARRALAMALACIESVKCGAPIAVNETAAV
jgi:myo-inositol 2-dehydrogenase/D-chiro-inositol 1-dehydrogenase